MPRLVADRRGYLVEAIRGLDAAGWTVTEIPASGGLPQNRLPLILRTPTSDYRYRILIYAVGSSSRGQPHERRVEITSTYAGGNLSAEPGYHDVVLGWDRTHRVFVGIDARRLHAGGHSHNASTFVARDAIPTAASASRVLTLARPSDLFGTEFQAYFSPRYLDDYLLNISGIHAGTYSGITLRRSSPSRSPSLSGAIRTDSAVLLTRAHSLAAPASPNRRVVEALESGGIDRLTRRITPEELEAAIQRAHENGNLGETYVFGEEQTRLRRAGRPDLADQVRWVALESVSEGYDILSYEADGTERLIEVKATQGRGTAFEITSNEWAVASRMRETYVIARVASVRTTPSVTWLRDPVQLEVDGRLLREASGWRVRTR